MSAFRDRLWRALEPVLSDTTSGSRAIAFAVAEELASIDADERITRDDYVAFARLILPRFSVFALVFDLFHRVGIGQFSDPGAEGATGAAFTAACDRWLSAAQQASDTQCVHASAALADAGVLATLSNSGAVLALARQLRARGCRTRFLCAESLPGGEGAVMATALSEAGVTAELVVDDALPDRLAEARALVMGADAVLVNEIWNKTGSRRLAARASELAIPVIVLAEYCKWAPSAWGLRLPDADPGEEGARDSRAGLFEPVGLESVTALACEDGLVAPSRVSSVMSSRPVFAPITPPF